MEWSGENLDLFSSMLLLNDIAAHPISRFNFQVVRTSHSYVPSTIVIFSPPAVERMTRKTTSGIEKIFAGVQLYKRPLNSQRQSNVVSINGQVEINRQARLNWGFL